MSGWRKAKVRARSSARILTLASREEGFFFFFFFFFGDDCGGDISCDGHCDDRVRWPPAGMKDERILHLTRELEAARQSGAETAALNVRTVGNPLAWPQR
jgi:hypothetical protein